MSRALYPTTFLKLAVCQQLLSNNESGRLTYLSVPTYDLLKTISVLFQVILHLKYETLIIVHDFLIKPFAKDDLDTGMKPQRTLNTNKKQNNFRYVSYILKNVLP